MNASEVNIDKLINDLKVVIRDADSLLKATAGEVGETARAAREKLTATLESAQFTCRQLEEKAREQARSTDHLVRTHPYESIGVAFGIGLLFGAMLGKR